MKNLKAILITLVLLFIGSTGVMASNLTGTGSTVNLPSNISSLTPIGPINSSRQTLGELIKSSDQVYYFDTWVTEPTTPSPGTPNTYGQSDSSGYKYPLIVNSGTTWLILNNETVNNLGINGAIQVASNATLNIVVCPTGGPGEGGVSLGTGISSGTLNESLQNSIGIVNNGTINVVGTTSDPNTSYLAIGIGASYSAYNNLAWNIREGENGNSTSSFNVYSAYTEILYGGSVATGAQQPTIVQPSAAAFIDNDNITVANGGVLQTSSSQPTVTTAVFDESTNLTVNDGVVLGGSTDGSSLPLGTTNITSSNSSLIAAPGLEVPNSGITDSLIVNLGSYAVAKTGDSITGSTFADSSATVVGKVTLGWGGQFNNFSFTQSTTTTTPTLSVPSNATLTIPASSDVTLGTNTILSNNGTIDVIPPDTTTT